MFRLGMGITMCGIWHTRLIVEYTEYICIFPCPVPPTAWLCQSTTRRHRRRANFLFGKAQSEKKVLNPMFLRKNWMCSVISLTFPRTEAKNPSTDCPTSIHQLSAGLNYHQFYDDLRICRCHSLHIHFEGFCAVIMLFYCLRTCTISHPTLSVLYLSTVFTT